MVTRDLENHGYNVVSMHQIDEQRRGLACLAMARLLQNDEAVFTSLHPYPAVDPADKRGYFKAIGLWQEKQQDRYIENYQQLLHIAQVGKSDKDSHRAAFVITKTMETEPTIYVDYAKPPADELPSAIDRLFVFNNAGLRANRDLVHMAIDTVLRGNQAVHSPIMRGVPTELFKPYLLKRSRATQP